MKQLFKPQLQKTLIMVLSLLVAVKLLWTVVELVWLPTSGVDHQEEEKKNLYYRVNFAPANGTVSKPQPVVQMGSIRDIKLIAVYSAQAKAIVAVEYKGKTSVLASGDEINGFVLEGAGSDYATFMKDEKSYRVDLVKPNGSKSGAGTIQPNATSMQDGSSKGPKGEIVDAGDHRIIDRSLIDHYAANMDTIFKDIGISDIKENGQVKGFKVSFIRQGSNFSKLGLQRGDVIKSVNGQEINSYNAAFGIYKEIGNIENLTMVIERDNKEVELEYEVN